MSGAPHQQVLATSAEQHVAVVAGDHRVVAEPALQPFGLRNQQLCRHGAGRCRRRGTADVSAQCRLRDLAIGEHSVISVTAADDVRARSTFGDVVSGNSIDLVMTGKPLHAVAGTVSVHFMVAADGQAIVVRSTAGHRRRHAWRRLDHGVERDGHLGVRVMARSAGEIDELCGKRKR
jgi:hypothetical protein